MVVVVLGGLFVAAHSFAVVKTMLEANLDARSGVPTREAGPWTENGEPSSENQAVAMAAGPSPSQHAISAASAP